MRPMLSISTDPWTLELAEPVGCAHESQVIEVPAPPGDASLMTLHGAGGPAWLQRSHRDPTRGYLLLPQGLPAFTRLRLVPGTPVPLPAGVRWDAVGQVLGNGLIELRLVDGAGASAHDDGIHPGTVRALRRAGGPWRGTTIFDTRSPSLAWRASVVEHGPVRSVWQCTTTFAPGQHHRMAITLDAGSAMAVVDEEFRGGVADQLVWDFTGDDLPRRFLLADAGPGHREVWPNLDHDIQVAALAPWTQCSQQPGRSDAFALVFADGDALAVVSRDGGDWSGARLNLLELWTRRWAGDELAARRGVPAGAKADATRSDGVPGRGRAMCSPHVCLECWIGHGSRRWLLALRPAADFAPVAPAVLGHFDARIDRATYTASQGLLRRLHTQHGVLGLQRQLDRVLEHPHPSPPRPGIARADDDRLSDHPDVRHWCPPELTPGKLLDYLEARVLGCWEGHGLAAVNVVIGRPLFACMLGYERLMTEGRLTPEQAALVRARLAWIAHLYADASFYPGESTMRPLGDPDGSEPTMMGMANQNFYTDALIVPGMFAEIFPDHPQSHAWRAWAERQWDLQLGFHLYPESGVWEESHSYCQHVLVTVFPWLTRLRDSGGRDFFADPRLALMLDGLVRQSAPADAARDGRRVIVPFGDHGADPAGYAWIYRRYADAIGEGTVAERLRWLHRALIGKTVPPLLGSELLRGLGAFLRSRDGAGNETLLALRTGGAWGHHHEDDGSLWLYADGLCLIGDAAMADNVAMHGERKHVPQGHSRWCPHGAEHRSFLWRFARGHALAHDLAATTPWCLAWCPVTVATAPGEFVLVQRHPLHHQRLVVQLAPGLWLVHDRCRPATMAEVRFQVCGPPTCDGPLATVALPSGRSLSLLSLAGHAMRIGLHDTSAGNRPAGERGADTWEAIAACGDQDSCIAISVGDPPTWRDGVLCHEGGSWPIAVQGDCLLISNGIPVWVDPPLCGEDPIPFYS